MTSQAAGQAAASRRPGVSRLVEEAIAAGFAWSVFSRNSSDGPLAWGIEVSEQAAVNRVEKEMRCRHNAAFGGIASAGTEKVCQRTTGSGFRWRQVSTAV